MAKRDKDSRREPFGMGGALLADGLGELAEYTIDSLGPVGLTVIGLKPLVGALRQLGIDHPAMIHGLDVMSYNLVRGFVSNPILQDAFKEILDAYFDRVKILSKDPSKGEVEKARGEGLEKAKAKLQGFLGKLKDSMKGFADALVILEPDERMVWYKWESTATDEQQKELCILKPRVNNANIIRDCVAMITATPPGDPLTILRAAYGREPTLFETLKAALKGEETPQTTALADKIAATNAKLESIGTASRDRAAAIRAKMRH
ncbi:hypothetical protein KJ925_04220 [Patescibacteria group bacterium]|nr:hypothetical protein [Patescibacteria group bacterium]